MKLEIQASGIAQPSTEKDFDLVATFFGGKRPLTREAYQLDLKDFTEFLGAASTADALNELTSLNSGDANHRVLLYRSMMQEKKLAPATINRRLATIRSITKLARVLGKITWAIEIPNLAVQNYRDTKGPALAAFKRMLDATKESSPIKSARDLALLRLLFDLALRASEAVSLDIADYDLEASTLAILGKGRTQKEKLTVPDTSKTALKIWITERGSEAGPLFVNFDRGNNDRLKRMTRCGLYQLVRTLAKKAGIKTRPHGLRHLSITEAIRVAQNNGYGIEEVMDHSRHRSVATLMIYRDKLRNVQGKIANLVSSSIEFPYKDKI